MTIDGGYFDNLLGPMEAQDDGTPLPKRAAWNFKDGVLATDNPGADTVDITAPLASGGSGGTVPALGTADTVLVTDGAAMSWQKIRNANVDAAAAILGTKIAPDFGTQDVTTSGNISTTGGYVEIGATVAGSGDIRLADAASLQFWGPAGSVSGIAKSAADTVTLGDGTNCPNLEFDASSGLRFRIGGSQKVALFAGSLDLGVVLNRFTTAVVTPSVTHSADATASVICDALMVEAQGASNSVGGASAGTSGPLLLRGGRGTVHADNLDGNVALHELPASWQTAEEIAFIGDCVTAPTGNPTAGGFLLSNFAGVTGLLGWHSPDGSTSTVGPAIYRRYVSLNTVADHPYTLLDTDYVVGVDSAGGIFTVNLTAAALNTGRHLLFKDEGLVAGALNITVDAFGGELIYSNVAALTAVINANGGAFNLYCDGTSWYVY